MNSQDAEEREIIRSWHSNAAPWARAIRAASIASRKLVTDQAIIDAVSSVSCARILDIGCGEGWLARALRALGMSVTGVDVVPALIAQPGVLCARLRIDCKSALARWSFRCRCVQFLVAGPGVGGLADRGAALVPE